MSATYTAFDGLSGREIVRLTDDAVEACAHAGDCEADTLAWLGRVEWLADDAGLRAYLREAGAWEDLDRASTETLRSRALWMAAWDVRESPETYVDGATLAAGSEGR